MKIRLFTHLTAVLLLLLSLSIVGLADDAPAWLKQASAASAPAYEKDVPGVVLIDEQQTAVSSDGKLVSTENYAVRLLTREGRGLAVARAYYLVSSGKIKEIKAWVIRPDGTAKEYDKKAVLDLISDPDDVYNEGRIKVIDASEDVDTGYVFGYTVVTEDNALFYQDSWAFQGRLPTLVSRFTLSMPAGWTASSITFNTTEVKPEGGAAAAAAAAAAANLSPRIVVNYTPDSKTQTVNRTFADWTDVSRWASLMHEGQVIVDDNVAAKARELTANASTELEKIRAIGSYVQNLQYISIDIGVGHGNGYKPRSSSLVLSRGYGDCKDKANLMRAMLKVLKIDAYPVAIYSGDPAFVREQWPSPRQFNHCIIAVKIGDGTIAATVITTEKLGRLLIFDATDQFTPVGDLPDYLQGSLALIAAGDSGGLSRMPVTTPESDRLERTVEASISELGEVKGKITERANGQTSTVFRRELRELSAADYRKALEGWLTAGATGAQVVNMQSKDRFAESGFDLDVDFRAPAYAQSMQGRLLVFKPVIVGRRRDIYLTEAKRITPVETDSWSMRETAVFSLPAGFVVDETPDAVTLDTEFGKYATTYQVKDGKLHFTRSIMMKRALIPVEKYAAIKAFFSKMRDAEQSPVVLLKK